MLALASESYAALRRAIDNSNDGKLKRTARTLPPLDPQPESREARPPMRAYGVDRKAAHLKHGSQKADEGCQDGYQKLECVVSSCSQVRLVLLARRSQKFSFGPSSSNREVAACRCETPVSISNTFERWGAELRLTCYHNQIVRCSCFHGMVVP